MSPYRDRKSETTTRRIRPQKRPFCLRAINCGFRKTGWWVHRTTPALFEFGTGFLPLETDAQKGARGDVSKQRPEIGDHDAREMAAKMAFLLASCQLRVSEDWVVGAPGLEPGTRGLKAATSHLDIDIACPCSRAQLNAADSENLSTLEVRKTRLRIPVPCSLAIAKAGWKIVITFARSHATPLHIQSRLRLESWSWRLRQAAVSKQQNSCGPACGPNANGEKQKLRLAS
jgi:hypothetical protein